MNYRFALTFPVSLVFVAACSTRAADSRVPTSQLVPNDGICRAQIQRPWYDFTSEPKPDGSIFVFVTGHESAATLLDVIEPVATRVCSSGGPSNAVRVGLKSSDGRTGQIAVRESSCVDLFLPHVDIAPGCVSPNLLCDVIVRRYKCLNNIPDGNVRTSAIWSEGWYVVAPTPAASVIKNGSAARIQPEPNPEHTIAPEYLVLSEKLLTLNVCVQGSAVIHVSKDALGGTDDFQKTLSSSCQFVQGKAIWVLPEEVTAAPQQSVTTLTYKVTW
jgi:hypothetical protein